MAQRRYEPVSVTDTVLLVLWVAVLLVLLFMVVGVLAGFISEPSWITQRWPYPGGRPVQ